MLKNVLHRVIAAALDGGGPETKPAVLLDVLDYFRLHCFLQQGRKHTLRGSLNIARKKISCYSAYLRKEN